MGLDDTILRRLFSRMADLGFEAGELSPESHSILTAVAGELAEMEKQASSLQERDDDAFLDGAAPDANSPAAGLVNLHFQVRSLTQITPDTTAWLNTPAPGEPNQRIETQFSVARFGTALPLGIKPANNHDKPVYRLTPQRGDLATVDGVDYLPLFVRCADIRRQLAAVESMLHPATRIVALAISATGRQVGEATLGAEAIGLAPQELLFRPIRRSWSGAMLVRQFFCHPGTLAYVALKGLAPLTRPGNASIEIRMEGPAVSHLLGHGVELLANCVPAVNGLRNTTEIEVDHTTTAIALPTEPGYCTTAIEGIEWFGKDRRWQPVMPLLASQYLPEGNASRVSYGLERTIKASGWNLDLILFDRERGERLTSRLKVHVATRQICPELPGNLMGSVLQSTADARVTIIDEASAPQFPGAPGLGLKRYLGLSNPLQQSDPATAAASLRSWLSALAGDLLPVAPSHRLVHARLRDWRVRLASSPTLLSVNSCSDGLIASLCLDDTPLKSDLEREPLGLFAGVLAHFLSWQTDGRPIRVTVTTSSGATWGFPNLYQGEVCS